MPDLTGDDLPETIMNVELYDGAGFTAEDDEPIWRIMERLTNQTATQADYDHYCARVLTNYLDGGLTEERYRRAIGAATKRYQQARNARRPKTP